jgi:secreted trypsin-like serine protease
MPTAPRQCGGVIVNHQQLLTAAHCLMDEDEDDFEMRPSDITVYVGSTKAFKGQKYAVKQVLVHPEFSFETRLNDIALITVEKSLQFSSRVGQACLPSKPAKDYVGQMMIVSGWGYTLNKTVTKDLQVLKDVKILGKCPK